MHISIQDLAQAEMGILSKSTPRVTRLLDLLAVDMDKQLKTKIFTTPCGNSTKRKQSCLEWALDHPITNREKRSVRRCFTRILSAAT